MKKTRTAKLIALLMAAVVIFLLSGCTQPKPEEKNDVISVVTTNFPLYDFTKAVFGEGTESINGNVHMLLSPGMESHSYEPTPQDIIKIQDCDLFIYVGGENDEWVEEILDSMDEPVRTLKLMDYVELMEEDEMGEDHDHDHEEGHEEEIEYDEHIWTSPANAAVMVQAIQEELCTISDEKQEAAGLASEEPVSNRFRQNGEAYITEILQLDEDFHKFFDTVENKTVFFGDRFPFAYFTKEYGLSYEAAFPGCYEGSEPSAATITGLIDDAKELGVSTIYYIEFSNHQIADVIADSIGGNTAMIHSCHNVTQEEMDAGVTYIDLMMTNLRTFTESMK
ncbi:MAG: metal ABC transporter substrate-binding protein [Lachnospiraceae bacterium]|nr:metal ABC transporter substrate-binding protein [Lachnospiraceae bacterium]